MWGSLWYSMTVSVDPLQRIRTGAGVTSVHRHILHLGYNNCPWIVGIEEIIIP